MDAMVNATLADNGSLATLGANLGLKPHCPTRGKAEASVDIPLNVAVGRVEGMRGWGCGCYRWQGPGGRAF